MPPKACSWKECLHTALTSALRATTRKAQPPAVLLTRPVSVRAEQVLFDARFFEEKVARVLELLAQARQIDVE